MTGPVSFQDAREIVRADEAPRWRDDDGTYMVADWGYEDAQSWRVVSGAREDILDGDLEFMPLDPLLPLVDKLTGEIERVTYLENPDRIEAMEPVGPVPPE